MTVPTEGEMTTAIGVVITEHIVAGRLEDMRLAGETVRYPQDTDEVDALTDSPWANSWKSSQAKSCP